MRGLVLLVIADVLLSAVSVSVKFATPGASPFLLALIRTGASSLLILLVLSARGKESILSHGKRDFILLALSGFFGVAVGMGFFIKAMAMMPVGAAIFLVFTYSMFTAVLAHVFLKENLRPAGALSLVLAVCGVYVIYGAGTGLGPNAALGSMFALLSAAGYSVFVVSMRHFERNGRDFWDVVFWPLALGSLMLVPFLLYEGASLSPDARTLAGVSGVVLFTFGGYLFYAKGLKSVFAGRAAILDTLVEPASSILLAFLILGESVPSGIFLGGGLILLANIIAELKTGVPRKRIR